MATILVPISGYSISGYWWLLISFILLVVRGYYINGY
jgi:hypothetical protein